jgi:hypothetical protein
VEVLRRLRDAVRRKVPKNDHEAAVFFLHHSAPASQSLAVENYVAKHPPYSPYLSPLDFFLYPRLKSVLKLLFTRAEQVTAEATRALTGIESFQEL